jgi:hypothetical protein
MRCGLQMQSGCDSDYLFKRSKALSGVALSKPLPLAAAA